MIVYEYPFNERIRAYLRLEFLFDRLFFFAREGDSRLHQVAVTALFDLLDACERTDVKGALLQDLERQRLALVGLRIGVKRVFGPQIQALYWLRLHGELPRIGCFVRFLVASGAKG